MIGQLVLIACAATLLALAFAVVVRRGRGTETTWRWWLGWDAGRPDTFAWFRRDIAREQWLLHYVDLGARRRVHGVIKNITGV